MDQGTVHRVLECRGGRAGRAFGGLRPLPGPPTDPTQKPEAAGGARRSAASASWREPPAARDGRGGLYAR